MQEQLYACEREIISFMYAKPHDAVFAVEDFGALGSYDAVRKALSRLTQSERIERICMGLYRLNPKRCDDVPALPSHEAVAQALAREATGGYSRLRSLRGAGSVCPMKTRSCQST